MKPLNAATILPEDGTAGTLIGRVWLPQAKGLPWSHCVPTACTISPRPFQP